MKTARRTLMLATVGLLAAGPSQARAQGYGASMSGPGYSYAFGYTPGYGNYYSATVRAGGATSSMYSGYPPVYFVGPGYGQVGSYRPARGASIQGPGYASSWGYTPGYGNYYNSTVRAGGVTSSIYSGYPPIYRVAPGYGYRGVYGRR